MRKSMLKVLLLLSSALVLVACSDSGGKDEPAQGSDVVEDKETGFNKLNVYEEELPSLEDEEHEKFDHGIEFDYINTNHLNENAIVHFDEYAIKGFNWKTGKPLWNNEGKVSKDRFTMPKVFGNDLYILQDETEYKVALEPDTELEELEETPYNLRDDYNSYEWENGYVHENDSDAETVDLTAYDKEDGSELWSKHLEGLKSAEYFQEEGDYVFFTRNALGDVGYYIVDKATGDMMHEEDGYYSDVYQIDDEIYVVNDRSIDVIDTNNWELNEVTSLPSGYYDGDGKDYLDYYEEEGLLAYHMADAIIMIDVEKKEPHLLIESVHEAGDDNPLKLKNFFHEGYLYIGNEADKQTLLDMQEDGGEHAPFTIVSVVDVQSGEIVAHHVLDYETVSFVKAEDNLIISTRDGAFFEFDLPFFE